MKKLSLRSMARGVVSHGRSRPDGLSKMNFNKHRPFADPDAALAKLLEIVGTLEADADGRISVGAISHAFLGAGGNASEYGAAMHLAVADGWLESHPSRACVKLLRRADDAGPRTV